MKILITTDWYYPAIYRIQAFKKSVTVPATLDKYLRAAKYIILTGLVALSIANGKFLLQVMCLSNIA